MAGHDMVGTVQRDSFDDNRGVRFEFELNHKKDTLMVARKSLYSSKTNSMEFPYKDASGLKSWLMRDDKDFIQSRFPNYSSDQREFIISGCTPEEWETLFPEGDEL